MFRQVNTFQAENNKAVPLSKKAKARLQEAELLCWFVASRKLCVNMLAWSDCSLRLLLYAPKGLKSNVSQWSMEDTRTLGQSKFIKTGKRQKTRTLRGKTILVLQLTHVLNASLAYVTKFWHNKFQYHHKQHTPMHLYLKHYFLASK